MARTSPISAEYRGKTKGPWYDIKPTDSFTGVGGGETGITTVDSTIIESGQVGGRTEIRVANATPDQQTRFNEAIDEFLLRLRANDGKNACAALFGGIKKAEELLKKGTKFAFGQTRNPEAAAQAKDKTVIINPTGLFMDTSGSVDFQINARRDFIRLTNTEAAAFVLAHELGHRAGKLMEEHWYRTDSVIQEKFTNTPVDD